VGYSPLAQLVANGEVWEGPVVEIEMEITPVDAVEILETPLVGGEKTQEVRLTEVEERLEARLVKDAEILEGPVGLIP